MPLDPTAEYLTAFFRSRQEDYELMMKDARSTRSTGYPPSYEDQVDVIQAIVDIVLNISENYWNLSVPDGYPSPKKLKEALVGLHDLAAKHLDRVYEINEKLGSPWPNEIQHASTICGEVKDAIDHALSLTADTTPLQADIHARLRRLLERLPLVGRQLGSRRKNGATARPTIKITDEYDVQDLLHAMLKIDFDDIRPEEWTPSYAGTSKRSDFLLKKEQIIVEVKKTRVTLVQREVADQLVIDIANYRNHPDCQHLFCAIWDTDNFLQNPAALKDDLETANPGFVTVIVMK